MIYFGKYHRSERFKCTYIRLTEISKYSEIVAQGDLAIYTKIFNSNLSMTMILVFESMGILEDYCHQLNPSV